MTLFKQRYRVESARLPGWDYASAGWYFVTICTQGQTPFFGEIVDGEMRHSAIGESARRCWEEIPGHFANVRLAEFVVMPSHVHGIVILDRHSGNDGVETQANVEVDAREVETRDLASLPQMPMRMGAQSAGKRNRFGPLAPGALQAIVHAYKSAVTRWCRKNGYRDFAWQARFYDHIIRNEESLGRIREYVVNNPLNWELEKDSPTSLILWDDNAR